MSFVSLDVLISQVFAIDNTESNIYTEDRKTVVRKML